jgi:hypothetical protein
MEVCAALTILLPAILLLMAFLTQWESRISWASLSAELPLLINAIENHLRKLPAGDLPLKISVRQGRDGEIEILPAAVGATDISLVPLTDMPAVQCHILGPQGQFSFLCAR